MIGNENAEEKLRLCGEVIAVSADQMLQHAQATLERHLPEIISRACEIRSPSKYLHQRFLPGIISDWKGLKAEQDEKNKVCGHLFNPFASIPINEITHSLLLRDLLDPRGSHGQGPLFLTAFLEQIRALNPKDGDWMVSNDGNVDICLQRSDPASVIIIENKSNWAADQPNQLYRYWHEKIHKPYQRDDYSTLENKAAFQIIYLPPAAGKRPAQHSLKRPKDLAGGKLPETLGDAGVEVKILTFRDDITAWLEHCERLIPSTNTRLRAYFQFYRERWS